MKNGGRVVEVGLLVSLVALWMLGLRTPPPAPIEPPRAHPYVDGKLLTVNQVALGMERQEVVRLFPDTDPDQPSWADASKGWEHFGSMPGSLGMLDSTDVRFTRGHVEEVSGSWLYSGPQSVLEQNGFRYSEQDKQTPAPDPRREQVLRKLGPPDSKATDPETKTIDRRFEVWTYGKLGLVITTHPVYPWGFTLRTEIETPR